MQNSVSKAMLTICACKKHMHLTRLCKSLCMACRSSLGSSAGHEGQTAEENLQGLGLGPGRGVERSRASWRNLPGSGTALLHGTGVQLVSLVHVGRTTRAVVDTCGEATSTVLQRHDMRLVSLAQFGSQAHPLAFLLRGEVVAIAMAATIPEMHAARGRAVVVVTGCPIIAWPGRMG